MRAKYWLGVGAQPSDPAWKLLTLVSSFFAGEMEMSAGIGNDACEREEIECCRGTQNGNKGNDLGYGTGWLSRR